MNSTLPPTPQTENKWLVFFTVLAFCIFSALFAIAYGMCEN